MKDYKVGQSYYRPGNGTTVVVVGSYRHYIDVMIVAGDTPYFDRRQIGSLSLHTHSPQLFNWEKRDAVYEVIAGGKRVHDKYHHYAVLHPGGKKLVAIAAGCRHFRSTAKALLHWKRRERRESYYNRKGALYKTNRAAHARTKDREMDRWSRAFVRKVERAMTKNRK